MRVRNVQKVARGLGLATVLMAVGCQRDVPTGPSGDAFALELVAEGLASPVALAEPPDGSGRLFVVDQAGRIRIIDSNGQLLQQPFLDITDRMVPLQPGGDERGLLGLAFHPTFATNGRFFVYYSAPLRPTAPTNWNHTARVSEFSVGSDPFRATPTSERVLLHIDQPQSNHNGGALAFGPDGMLYISLGDGGAANDVGVGHVTGGNAQNPSNLLGSILRIDVNTGNPYALPAGNPFVGRTDGRGEVYAYGFRNPYRFSFDRLTGDLLVGDVGQGLWEEVNRVTRGGNYGWNRREGTGCFEPANPNQPPPTCPATGLLGELLIDPVIEYANANQPGGLGTAVIGGYVYRGAAIQALGGRYLFGDFTANPQAPAGRVFVATPALTGLWDFETVDFPDRPGRSLGHYLKGFGEDASGELYLLTSDQSGPGGTSGKVYRLVLRTLTQ